MMKNVQLLWASAPLHQVGSQLQLPKANWAQLRRAIIVFEVPILARELKSLQMSLNKLKDDTIIFLH